MFQFPPNPAVGQTFNPVAGVTFRWNGTAWFLLAGPGAFISQAEADLRYVELSEVPNISNRIINGKMAIDQRTNGAGVGVVNTGNNYSMDRWYGQATAPGAFVLQREADPTFPGEFRMVTAVSIASALPATSVFVVSQNVEGINCADLAWGTVNAQPITIAFEVQSTLAGVLPLAIRNSALVRSYIAPVTINAPNVREQKVVTIPGDTAGVWLTNNLNGMYVSIVLGASADTAALAPNVWTAGNLISVPGATNFMATPGHTINLRNFRLYRGSVDFGPDRRLFADELALCQRYFQTFGFTGAVPWLAGRVTAGNGAQLYTALRVPMRATPTLNMITAGGIQLNDVAVAEPFLAIVLNESSPDWLCVRVSTTGATMTPGRPVTMNGVTTASGLQVSAEL